MSEQVAKRKRMRAGHKASTSRIIAQVTTAIESPQVNLAVLKRMAENLREKQATITKLDAEILEAITEEDEIKEEIEQADIYREKVELAIIDLESEICAIERHEPNKGQQSSASSPRETSTVEGDQSSTMNRDVPVSLDEDRPPTRSAIPPQVPIAQTSALPSVTVEPALDARRAPKVKLPKVELKKFNGDLTNWVMFWDVFESSVHSNPELSDIDRFNYLHSLLEGTAADAISGISLSSANHAEAVAVLKKRFGNKQQVVNRHMDLLMQLEAVASIRDLKGLRRLYDKVEGHVRSLKSLGVPQESYGSLLSSIIMK